MLCTCCVLGFNPASSSGHPWGLGGGTHTGFQQKVSAPVGLGSCVLGAGRLGTHSPQTNLALSTFLPRRVWGTTRRRGQTRSSRPDYCRPRSQHRNWELQVDGTQLAPFGESESGAKGRDGNRVAPWTLLFCVRHFLWAASQTPRAWWQQGHGPRRWAGG